MKILIVGDWHSDIHEEVVFKALTELGHTPFRFSWHQYFRCGDKGVLNYAVSIFRKIENKFIFGPSVRRLNIDLLATVRRICPQIIFVYRGTHIVSKTLREIKRLLPSSILVGYNNDDPFARGHPYGLWRHFNACVPVYDIVLAYRQHNLEDFMRAGAREVHLLRSWFVPYRNFPVILTEEEKKRFSCDVVFVGHFENDGRLNALEKIAEAGFNLKIFGPDWNEGIIKGSRALRKLHPVSSVRGADYNKALCGAKIALCFLSTLNRDTYTRRCFEIPASGGFMLSQYSDDLSTLFLEGEEVEFFRSEFELISKIEKYLKDDERRLAVAKSGLRRVWEDGHDVTSRIKGVLELVNGKNTHKKK